MKYFRGSIIFAITCLLVAFGFGWYEGGINMALSTLFIVAVLWVLEVSLSFDNAVVNVSTLKTMDATRRRRFLTWWIWIAVVGMRVVFPIVLVAIFGQISPRSALTLAITDASQYGQILTSAHVSIAGFGWAFLMMVGFKFFFDSDKVTHWLHRIEIRLTKLGKIEAIEIVIVLLLLELISYILPIHEAHDFFVSGVWGLVTYIIIHGVSELMQASDTTGTVAKSGAMAFLYLELLDASFSLDGVIGAFALSTNLLVIALGLGIGAYFVRSITIYLYEAGTLTEYRYLEHGAFYAIIALALMMFAWAIRHIPELITGLVGAGLIGLALYSSWKHNTTK